MAEKININPTGIAWEKQDVVHCTNAGIIRIGKEKKFNFRGFSDAALAQIREESPIELSDHPIIAGSDYAEYGHEIVNVNDEYLSIRSFFISGMYKVCSYEGLVEKRGLKLMRDLGSLLCTNYWDNEYDEEGNLKHPEVTAQLRIYKDRKVSVVLRMEWADGTVRFCCVTPSTKTNRYTYLAFFINWGERLSRDDSSEADFLTNFVESNKSDVFIVENDEEIREHAFKIAKKNRFFNNQFFVAGTNFKVTKPGQFFWSSSKGVGSKQYEKFDEDTKKMVSDFLGINSEENSVIKKAFDSIKYDRQYSVKDEDDKITNLCWLEYWLSTSAGSAKAKVTNENFVKEFWPTVHWGEEKEQVWERRGDNIICSCTGRNGSKAVFIYDVSTKSRKLIVKSYYTHEPKVTIPGLAKGIMGNFDWLDGYREWDREKMKYITIPSKQKIWDDISVEELVAGTNLEWIYNNMELLPNKFIHCCRNTLTEKSKQFGKKMLGSVAIAVLATTGDALLEQLLKNKQFKLYFEALHDKGYECERFYDVDKHGGRYSRNACLYYHSKEKSLKKMFGMTMNQIKEYEKNIEWIEDDNYDYYDNHDVFHIIPRIANATEVLGLESLSQLDEKTFTRVIELSKSTERVGYYQLYGEKNVFEKFKGSAGAKKMMEHMTASQKIDFMLKYEDAIDVLDDYLNMREQLITIQVSRPGELIFDGKQYPVRPESAVKLIRFIPGAKNPLRRWQTIDTVDEFKKYINERFFQGEDEEEDGGKTHASKFELVKNKETGAANKVYGALITLTPAAHLIYLHDELSRWFQLYKDEAEMELFKGALKRVQHLEWSDDSEDGELCIVAPRDPAEIRNEGSVLSHCVASYVDPIIKGTENIMFIRRKDMREEPFFTVDIDNSGAIRQIHCYRNGNTSASDIARAYAECGREVYNTKADVIKFVKRWCKAMHGKIDPSSIRPTYGALCAAR